MTAQHPLIATFIALFQLLAPILADAEASNQQQPDSSYPIPHPLQGEAEIDVLRVLTSLPTNTDIRPCLWALQPLIAQQVAKARGQRWHFEGRIECGRGNPHYAAFYLNHWTACEESLMLLERARMAACCILYDIAVMQRTNDDIRRDVERDLAIGYTDDEVQAEFRARVAVAQEQREQAPERAQESLRQLAGYLATIISTIHTTTAQAPGIWAQYQATYSQYAGDYVRCVMERMAKPAA